MREINNVGAVANSIDTASVKLPIVVASSKINMKTYDKSIQKKDVCEYFDLHGN